MKKMKKSKSKKTGSTWGEKLRDSKNLPRVVKITGKMSKRWGKGTVVIPAPIEVDRLMKKVSKGRLVTSELIRKSLARKHKASIACPLTTGIFAWVASHAAEEERGQGKKRITPYWRTLKTGGFLNPKYPGGEQRQKKLLEKEGHRVVKKGKKYKVLEFEKSLQKL